MNATARVVHKPAATSGVGGLSGPFPVASGCEQVPPRNPGRLTPHKTTANHSRPCPAATMNPLVAWLR